MSDSAEKVKKIVVEHLGVEADKVTEEASFIDDLGADSLDIVELVGVAFEEKNSVSKFPMTRRKRSPPSRTRSTISKRTRAKAVRSGTAGRGGDAAHAFPASHGPERSARGGREAFMGMSRQE